MEPEEVGEVRRTPQGITRSRQRLRQQVTQVTTGEMYIKQVSGLARERKQGGWIARAKDGSVMSNAGGKRKREKGKKTNEKKLGMRIVSLPQSSALVGITGGYYNGCKTKNKKGKRKREKGKKTDEKKLGMKIVSLPQSSALVGITKGYYNGCLL
jgi:hypothetical protein